jgi:hypothetical protein
MTRILAAIALALALPVRAEVFVGLAVPPLSLETGATTFAPFSVFTTDEFNNPVQGIGVTFGTDPACGTFAGASVVSTVTADFGRADSPLFTALAAERFCRVYVEVEGRASTIEMEVYEFSADRVVIQVPAAIEVPTGRRFHLQAVFTADGVPVYPVPIQVHVTSAPNGATATVDPNALSDGSNVLAIPFFANGKSGHYTITVQRGPVSATAAVVQRGK